MSDEKPANALGDLDAKLRAARARNEDGNPDAAGRTRIGGGMGLAFKLAIDIVAALAVGVGIGFLLDRWLGTKPWLLLLFCVLGAVAGIWNVMRTVLGSNAPVGFKRPPRAGDGNGTQREKRD